MSYANQLKIFLSRPKLYQIQTKTILWCQNLLTYNKLVSGWEPRVRETSSSRLGYSDGRIIQRWSRRFLSREINNPDREIQCRYGIYSGLAARCVMHRAGGRVCVNTLRKPPSPPGSLGWSVQQRRAYNARCILYNALMFPYYTHSPSWAICRNVMYIASARAMPGKGTSALKRVKQLSRGR